MHERPTRQALPVIPQQRRESGHPRNVGQCQVRSLIDSAGLTKGWLRADLRNRPHILALQGMLMPLPFRERLAMLMPPSFFYRRRIAEEARSGEPELSVLAKLLPRGGTAVDIGANQGFFAYASQTSPVGSSHSSPIQTMRFSRIGCCEAARRFMSWRSPTRLAL
jgi:hypothetical protein